MNVVPRIFSGVKFFPGFPVFFFLLTGGFPSDLSKVPSLSDCAGDPEVTESGRI